MESFKEIMKKESNYDKQIKEYQKAFEEVKAYESFKGKVKAEFGDLSDEQIDMIQSKMLDKDIKNMVVYGCIGICLSLVVALLGLSAIAIPMMIGSFLFFVPIITLQCTKLMRAFE